jgi:hypothetical protein
VLGLEDEQDFFNVICPLVEGRSIILDEDNREKVSLIGEILENDELLGFALNFQESLEAISVSNCISRLQMRGRCGMNVEEELKFIASHFYGIEKDELKELKINLLEEVLSQSDLCLVDEDSFLDFILSLGEEYSTLLGYVECRFLSVSGIEKFLSSVSGENVGSGIWNSICRRLQCEIVARNVKCSRFHFEEFEFSEGGAFSGILSDLTKKCGGNVHENGIVNITSSGDNRNNCWQIANHGWTDCWISQNDANSWVCFEFKNSQISLTSYTLRSHTGTVNYLVHWVIDASNDERSWVEIDRRDTQELVGNNLVKNFRCSGAQTSEFFRFIRIRQTRETSSNSNCLVLCNVEFFGASISVTQVSDSWRHRIR